jgi:hypothetical protein
MKPSPDQAMQRTARPDAMTVIEIRPHRWGWKVFEALGVEPVFLEKRRQSTMRKPVRASGQVRFVFWIPAETSNAPLGSTTRIGCCELLLFQWAI